MLGISNLSFLKMLPPKWEKVSAQMGKSCRPNGRWAVLMDNSVDVHILGAYVHKKAKYEVSMFKPVARRTVHRCQTMPDDDNDTQQTIHYYIGSLAFVTNETKYFTCGNKSATDVIQVLIANGLVAV